VLAIRLAAAALCLPLFTATSPARTDEAPDRVRMIDGTEFRGLILQNTRDVVVIETKTGEARIPKEYIRRIDDAPNGEAVYADIVGQGELPSWRSIVHDLRMDDGIRKFEEIPPTAIKKGLLRNIPYLSFRANDKWKLNVYGSGENPAAIEFGFYGAKRPDKDTRRMFREFVAGHLASKDEIHAFYSLGPENREARAGKLAFRLIRPKDPDGCGGTWLVVYRPDRLEQARLPDKAYAATMRPFGDVNRPDGSLRADRAGENSNWLDRTFSAMTGTEPELRGFYRDKNGIFRVLRSGS
jgi:hypothetical protein